MRCGMNSVDGIISVATVMNGHGPSVKAPANWATSFCWYGTCLSRGHAQAETLFLLDSGGDRSNERSV
jgi:hypothetical protein